MASSSSSFINPAIRRGTSGASSHFNTNLWAGTLVASIPLIIWVRDTFGGFVKVHGSSMNPTLHNGDVVFVRKCELGIIPETLASLIFGDDHDDNDGASRTERARLLRYEMSLDPSSLSGAGSAHPPMSRLYDCPPLALSGHVVVYKNPRTAYYPKQELCCKRVIGVSGQYVRTITNDNSSSLRSRRGGAYASVGRRHNNMISVPSYSLYVEGDNLDNSQDSRQIGPISKGLLVGVAEYVVWPPSRWGRIQRRQRRRETTTTATTTTRAFWP